MSFSCDDFKTFTQLYIQPSISFVSVALNLTCFLVFNGSTLDTYGRSNMFQLLKCKSMLDAIEASTRIIKMAYVSPFLRNTLFSCLMRILVGDYVKAVTSTLSFVTELGADLNRLLELRNSNSCWRRRSNFRAQLTAMVTITGFVYVYTLFEKTIYIEKDESNSTIYTTRNSNFGDSAFFKYTRLINGIVRDMVFVAALLFIDCLVLIEFRRVLQQKKRILSNTSSGGGGGSESARFRSGSSVSRVEIAERRLTQMVLVKSSVRVCGHMPHFFKYIPSLEVNTCFREVSSLFFIGSDTVNFFIYYTYNRIFRAYFKSFFFESYRRKRPSKIVRKRTLRTESLNVTRKSVQEHLVRV